MQEAPDGNEGMRVRGSGPHILRSEDSDKWPAKLAVFESTPPNGALQLPDPHGPLKDPCMRRLIHNTVIFVRATTRVSLALVLLAAVLVTLLVTDTERDISSQWVDEQVQGFPDEFARYMHAITTSDDETTSGYQPGYRRSTLTRLKEVRKGSGQMLPWVERGPGNVGGRTRGLVIDRNDPTGATWLAGSVSGGIWRTTTSGNTWTPVTEDAPRLSISSIAQAPSDPQILYAGTGEGFPNGDAAIGDGILKSVDGGLTWFVLPSTTGGRDFLFVNRVIISDTDSELVLAAAQEGIWRSTDGGSSWDMVLEANGFFGFYQIIAEPGNFSTQYATDEIVGVWKSDDAGLTWYPSSDGIAEAGSGNRIEIDVSPADPATLFALVEDRSEGGTDPVYISRNGGENWLPFLPMSGSFNPDIAGEQGWYDQMVHAHPFDPDVVFMGGIQMYRLTGRNTTTTLRRFLGVNQEGTQSFLDFVDFGASHLGGGLRLGTEEEESTISEASMVSVEIRFGPGRSQMAHRFVPPDQSGVDFVDYPYEDYVPVPFEVWDITNNRQLHVSFRDRENNGAFDLDTYDRDSPDREYVLVSSRTYTPGAPDPDIGQDGGVRNDLAYFFWPILASEATWDPSALPESTLRLNYGEVEAPTRLTSIVGSGIHVDQHVMRSFNTGTSGSAFRLVAGNDGGVYFSGDGGQNWTGRFRGYNTTQFYGVDKKPGENAYIGGTQDNGSWRSQDNPSPSSSWIKAGGGDGFDVIWHKQNGQQMIATSQYTYITRSLNGGSTFSVAMTDLTDTGNSCECAQFITSLSSRADNSNVVYTLGESGVWRSRNFAGTWSLIPIPASEWGYAGVSGKVHVSNADGDIVLAGYEMDPVGGGGDVAGNLQVSSDDGATFSSATTPSWAPGRLTGLSSSFEDPNTIYVTFSQFGSPKIIRSTNLGETWEDLTAFRSGPNDVISSNGFPDVSTFDVIDFPNSPVIWAATEIGLVESVDDGATWRLADNGLPAVSIWQMKLIDGQVVLATHGRGVWTVPASAAISVATEPDASLPTEFVIESAWPNPFGPELNVSWVAPQAAAIRIELIDIQGRVASTLFTGTVAAGRQQQRFTTTGLASGAYFLRIRSGDRVLSRSVMKVR